VKTRVGLKLKPHLAYPYDCGAGAYITQEIGGREFADFLNNKSAEGWELFQSSDELDTDKYRDCIFRRVVQ
jgi:hypothetical protein